MISIKNIKEKSMNLRKEKIDNVCFMSKIYRPVSFYLTWPFINVGISANIVSLISILVAVIGMVISIVGDEFSWYLLSLGVFIFWNFFDCIDGNIARYTKEESENGVLWDAVGGYFALSLYSFSIGIIAYKLYSDYLYIVAGGTMGVAAMISRLIMHKYMLLNNDKVSDLQNSGKFNAMMSLAFQLTTIDGFMIPLAVFSLYLSIFEYYVLIYTFIYYLILLYVIRKYLKL